MVMGCLIAFRWVSRVSWYKGRDHGDEGGSTNRVIPQRETENLLSRCVNDFPAVQCLKSETQKIQFYCQYVILWTHTGQKDLKYEIKI